MIPVSRPMKGRNCSVYETVLTSSAPIKLRRTNIISAWVLQDSNHIHGHIYCELIASTDSLSEEI